MLSTAGPGLAGCSPATAIPASDIEPSRGAEVRVGHTSLEEPSPEPEFSDDAVDALSSDVFPAAIVDRQPMLRVLRGDFEPPDTLLLAYEEDWVDSLEQIVSAASGQAKVLLLTTPEQRWAKNLKRLVAHHHVSVVSRKLDSPWVRDYGPLQTYEFEAGPLWLDFSYAWDRPLDDEVPSSLSLLLNARVEAPSITLDGGAIVSNGEGLCAITRTSLVDAGLSDPSVGATATFLAGLGCHTTAVLPNLPEETTGHADIIVQFLAHDLAMVAWVAPEESPTLSRTLDRAAQHLATAAELGDYHLQIVRIPIAAAGETFYSYVNSARLRTRLLVPRFNNIAGHIEQSAYASLETALPGVSLVPIDADAMIQLGGAVHCITLGLGPTRSSAKHPLRRLARPAERPPRRG